MRDCLTGELRFRTSRSSGPGGQHVNKTESRVELIWSPEESLCLSEEQKILLITRLGKRLSGSGQLIMASEKYRSQYRNRLELVNRFLDLIQSSLVPVKPRKATGPTPAGVEKRIRDKKIRGEIKKSRRDPDGG